MIEHKKKVIKAYFQQLQQKIAASLGHVDGQVFVKEQWRRAEDKAQTALAGGGVGYVLQGGHVIEKGGINFSHVTGQKMPASATAHRPELAGRRFEAMGVSLVIHPRNPYAPTSHMNVRFFIAEDDENEPIWWFGGGYDLTPYYGFEEDCVHWHKTAQVACQPFGEDIYSQHKHWCDDYFYLKHRQEPRGIGGLFFDDWNQEKGEQWTLDACFKYIQAVGDSYLEAYLPILEKRKDTPFGEHERDFQCYRRGRYVEFNLVFDRGTLFGLQSGGRTESILMSMPPVVHWHYQGERASQPDEQTLLNEFLCAKNWV